MGFRTVVMLSNDRSSEWSKDEKLGEKILHSMNRAGDNEADFGTGAVVQCVHGDTQTLAVLDGYTMFRPLTSSLWSSSQSDEDVDLKLLKQAAERLGYTLRKKPVTK